MGRCENFAPTTTHDRVKDSDACATAVSPSLTDGSVDILAPRSARASCMNPERRLCPAILATNSGDSIHAQAVNGSDAGH